MDLNTPRLTDNGMMNTSSSFAELVDLNIEPYYNSGATSVKLFRGACGSKLARRLCWRLWKGVKLFRGACGSKSLLVCYTLQEMKSSSFAELVDLNVIVKK